jgi:hypothetical protein
MILQVVWRVTSQQNNTSKQGNNNKRQKLNWAASMLRCNLSAEGDSNNLKSVKVEEEHNNNKENYADQQGLQQRAADANPAFVPVSISKTSQEETTSFNDASMENHQEEQSSVYDKSL